jgi:nitrate/nitrite transporter NarK
MEETVFKKDHFSKSTVSILIVTSSAGYTSLLGVAYVMMRYYNLFQEGTGFTDAQVGTLASIIGTVAIFGYFFGGILADIFKPRFLMNLSYIGGAVCGIVMSLMPSYGVFMMLEVALAIFVIFTYWSAFAKFIRTLGPPEREGRLFGIFYSGNGIIGAVVGFLVSWLLTTYSGVLGLKIMLYCYSALMLIAAAAMMIYYKPPAQIEDAGANEKSGGYKLSDVITLLKMPEIWLISISGGAIWLINVGITYFSPLLKSSFGVSLSAVTLLSTIRASVIGIVVSPIAGILIDKFASTRLLLFLSALIAALMGVVLIMPWTSSFQIAAIIILLVAAVLYRMSVPTWFTPVSDIGIPDVMRGTAIGVTSVLMFASDAFMYSFASGLIEKNGTEGLRTLYMIIMIACIMGAIAAFCVRRMINAKKALQQ